MTATKAKEAVDEKETALEVTEKPESKYQNYFYLFYF